MSDQVWGSVFTLTVGQKHRHDPHYLGLHPDGWVEITVIGREETVSSERVSADLRLEVDHLLEVEIGSVIHSANQLLGPNYSNVTVVRPGGEPSTDYFPRGCIARWSLDPYTGIIYGEDGREVANWEQMEQ